jgi:4-hydroxy-tetrahydrodipicolinate synthase
MFIVLATPFPDSGGLDLYSMDKLVDFYLEAGVHGITIFAMMGESDKLTAGDNLEIPVVDPTQAAVAMAIGGACL